MKKAFVIANKEIAHYFQSPIAYIVLFITISVFNVFFFMIVDQNQEATLRDIFKVMEFLFVFIVPLLTMKTFAEEKMAGTMEFLMTTPTPKSEIVVGKYLGALTFFSILIFSTGVYYIVLEVFAQPDRTATFVGYFGVWLEGALFIAIGVFMSSLTNNQIIAAICSYLFIFLLYFSMGFITYVKGVAEAVIRTLATSSHLENFSVGIISLSDLTYYVSLIILFLILTRISIENRLWR